MKERPATGHSTGGTVESELRQLETDLLQPEVRHNPETLSSRLADEFCEFGSSGRVYTKQEIIDALQTESPERFSVTDLTITVLAEGVALVRYRTARHATSDQRDSASLRSSVWIRRANRWQMVFHQGTKLATGATRQS